MYAMRIHIDHTLANTRPYCSFTMCVCKVWKATSYWDPIRSGFLRKFVWYVNDWEGREERERDKKSSEQESVATTMWWSIEDIVLSKVHHGAGSTITRRRKSGWSTFLLFFFCLLFHVLALAPKNRVTFQSGQLWTEDFVGRCFDRCFDFKNWIKIYPDFVIVIFCFFLGFLGIFFQCGAINSQFWQLLEHRKSFSRASYREVAIHFSLSCNVSQWVRWPVSMEPLIPNDPVGFGRGIRCSGDPLFVIDRERRHVRIVHGSRINDLAHTTLQSLPRF